MEARETKRLASGPADKAAKEGPNPRERIKGGMNNVGPGRFILTNPAAKGPVYGDTGSRKIPNYVDGSKSTEGMETVKTKK